MRQVEGRGISPRLPPDLHSTRSSCSGATRSSPACRCFLEHPRGLDGERAPQQKLSECSTGRPGGQMRGSVAPAAHRAGMLHSGGPCENEKRMQPRCLSPKPWIAPLYADMYTSLPPGTSADALHAALFAGAIVRYDALPEMAA